MLVAWFFLARTGRAPAPPPGQRLFQRPASGLYPIALIGYNAYNTLCLADRRRYAARGMSWCPYRMTSVGVQKSFCSGVSSPNASGAFRTTGPASGKPACCRASYFGAAHLPTSPAVPPRRSDAVCLCASWYLLRVYFRTGIIWYGCYPRRDDITSMLIGGLYGTQYVLTASAPMTSPSESIALSHPTAFPAKRRSRSGNALLRTIAIREDKKKEPRGSFFLIPYS